MEKVYEFYIRTTPERLWEAITDSETRARFHFGNRITSDWTPGSGYVLTNPRAGGPLAEGENLEVDPPRRLVQSMVALWSDEVKSEGVSRVTWEIEPVGDSCHLTLTHDQLRDGANPQLYGGWPMVLSGLKTWLETGRRAHHAGIADVRLTAPTAGPTVACRPRDASCRPRDASCRPRRRIGSGRPMPQCLPRSAPDASVEAAASYARGDHG